MPACGSGVRTDSRSARTTARRRPRSPEQWIQADDPRGAERKRTEAALVGGVRRSRHWTDSVADGRRAEPDAENGRAPHRRGPRRTRRGRGRPACRSSRRLTAQYNRNAYERHGLPVQHLPQLVPVKHYYDNWSAGFDAAWELDFWGRFRRAVEAADANLDAQVAGYNKALVLLQAEVAANYIQMRAFEERLQLARKNVDLQKETLRIVDARAIARAWSPSWTCSRPLTTSAKPKSLIPLLATGHRRAQNRLCILMGMPPQQLAARCSSARGRFPPRRRRWWWAFRPTCLRRRPNVPPRRARGGRPIGADRHRQGRVLSAHRHYRQASACSPSTSANCSRRPAWPARSGPGFRWNILNYGRILNNVRRRGRPLSAGRAGLRDTVLRADEEVENGIVAFLREQERRQGAGRRAPARPRVPWRLPSGSMRRA